MNARKSVSIALVLLLLLSLTACGGASEAADKYYEAEGPMEMGTVSNESLSSTAGTAQTPMPENRKLIRTVNMDAETEELDSLVSAIDDKIAELQGYVESREVYNGSAYAQRRYRRADLKIRIPAENLNSFVAHVSANANIVSSNETVDDVTLQYVDTESRVKALETEQERLLALLEQAENMAELLEIEARLTDVRYELESVASKLRTLENQVTYATVYLSINEVQEYTPVEEETLWQRISGGFTDSIDGIADGAVEVIVWILANSPYLVLWGGILSVAVVTGKKLRRKRTSKKTAPPKTESEE